MTFILANTKNLMTHHVGETMSTLAVYHLDGKNINLNDFFGGAIWKYLSKSLMHILFGLKIPDLEIDPIVTLTPIRNTVYTRIFTETTKCLAKELLRKWILCRSLNKLGSSVYNIIVSVIQKARYMTSLMVQDSKLPMKGAQVQSPVLVLRSHMQDACASHALSVCVIFKRINTHTHTLKWAVKASEMISKEQCIISRASAN